MLVVFNVFSVNMIGYFMYITSQEIARDLRQLKLHFIDENTEPPIAPGYVVGTTIDVV